LAEPTPASLKSETNSRLAGCPQLSLLGTTPRPWESPWLANLRRCAQQSFDGLSWPTAQEEEWRRTDMSEIDLSRFRIFEPDGNACVKLTIKSGNGISGEARFLNGSCRKRELSPECHQQNVEVLPFNTFRNARSGGVALPTLQRILEKRLQTLDNRFLALHFSSLSHGVFLYIPPYVDITNPFLIDLVEAGDGVASSPHIAIVLEQAARAKVILRTRGPQVNAGNQSRDSSPARPAEAPGFDKKWRSFVNLGIDLVVGESAALEFYHFQDLSTDALAVIHSASTIARDGHLKTFEAALGSGLLKSRFDGSLDGPGCEAYLNGIYLSRGRQHLDIRTVQRHRAPHTTSRVFYKGALKDRSRSIYQGLIEVCPEAAKTDAFLTNRNLILNEGSRADSIPSLQIDTSDVKCSHGAATGKINEEQLFYLMSRGLDREEAAQMLVLGFFEELLARTPEQFAASLRKLIGVRIGSNDFREAASTALAPKSAVTNGEARHQLLRRALDAGR
jgi:Fe-S cluster assembly protein SufD